MSFSFGTRASFKLQSAAGVLTDLSPYLVDVQLHLQSGLVQLTAGPGDSRDYVVGQETGVITLSGRIHPTALNLLGALPGLQSARDWEYGPQGTAAGSVKVTGKCLLTSLVVETDIDGASDWSATLQLSDALVVSGTY